MLIRPRAQFRDISSSGLSDSVAVEDLAALKALTSRPFIVLVRSGQAKGQWAWWAGSATTADDALTVECTSGEAGRYKRVWEGGIYSASWWGFSTTATATANTAALNAMFDTIGAFGAGGGGTVTIQPGEYAINDIVNINYSNITIRAEGVTINGTAVPFATVFNTQCAFLVSGELNATVTAVGSDIAVGDKQITVASTTGFATDDTIFIKSTTDLWPTGSNISSATKAGAMHRIRSVDDATHLTLYDGSFFFYTAASSTVQKVDTVKNVVFEGINVVMGGVNKSHCGIRFKYTEDCWVRGGSVIDSEETNIRTEYSIGGGVEGVTVSGATSPDYGGKVTNAVLSPLGTVVRLTVATTAGMTTGETRAVSGVTGTTEANGSWVITVIDGTHIDLAGTVFANAYVSGGIVGVTVNTGYGIAAQSASRNFTIKDCRTRDNKHSVSGGGNYPSIFIDVVGNNCEGGLASANPNYDLECHEECLWWNFTRNKIAGSDDTTGSGGLMIRGQRCTAAHNHITNAFQYGIYIHSFDTAGVGLNGCDVSHNVVEGARVYGIYAFGETTSPLQNIIISNNTIRNTLDHGIRARVVLGGVFSGNTITDSPTSELFNDCEDINHIGGSFSATGAAVQGIDFVDCVRVVVTGGRVHNTTGSSGAGILVRGTTASSDVSITGPIVTGYNRPVSYSGTVDYFITQGINGRDCANPSLNAATNRFDNFNFPASTDFSPVSDDGQALGIGASLRWSDLYLATGGALDWNNGTYRLTQSSTTLSSSGNFSLPSGYLRRGTPVTKTANITVGVSDNWIINNKAGSTATWTLPAVSQIGREIMIQNYQAQTVVSASSNVVPLGGGAAGTAILSANVGRWCTLVSDGTNWVIMAGVI